MSDLAAAVDPLGRAFVTWRETQGTTIRVLVAQAPIGGTFKIVTLAKGTGIGRPVVTARPDGGAAVAWPAPAGWQAVTTTAAKFGTLSKVSDALTGDDRNGAQAALIAGPAAASSSSGASSGTPSRTPARSSSPRRTPALARGISRMRGMPAQPFVDKLNEQIGHEYAAHQQYVAIAVWYDAETLPQLAAFFYAPGARGARPRDDDGPVPARPERRRSTIPGVDGAADGFADIVEPVQLALDQEKRVTEQINALAGSRARARRLHRRAVHAVVHQGAGRGGRVDDRPAARRRALTREPDARRGLARAREVAPARAATLRLRLRAGG